MRKFLIFNFSFLICAFLFSACSPKQKAPDRPAFSSDSAYAYIEKQMSYGPRVPNSKAHNDCAVWLIQQLRAFGAVVELQRGQMTDYKGDPQQIYNIIAHFSTPEIASRPRILLCAHYDCRPWCDEEEDYNDRFYNVPGANDGASGVGVLLEVARQLGLRMDTTNHLTVSPINGETLDGRGTNHLTVSPINGETLDGRGTNHQSPITNHQLSTPVDIVFFDCEDMGTPRVYTGPERANTWCLGSQLWATNYVKMSNDQSQITNAKFRFGILLDMVGAPDAIFPREHYSTQYAANYQESIWRAAEQLGYSKFFVKQKSYPITDDHYYVNSIAGIPCVDVIHYDVQNATGFPWWWHTRNDNMDNIAKSTLQAVGEVVMSQL